MYNNVHIGINNLRRPGKISPGGLCRIYFTPIQDVKEWPDIDPMNGNIQMPIVLKPGATLFLIEATEKDKTFEEESKSSTAGVFVTSQVVTSLPGNTAANIQTLAAMQGMQFALIISDKDGISRLIGNKETGATIQYQFTSGKRDSSRGRSITWLYESMLPVPQYLGGTIVMDNQTVVFNRLVFVARFRVSAPGAPMVDGDTAFIHPLLANSQFIMLADGKAIHQINDFPYQRFCYKPFASDTITVNGGVTDGEVIEIYKF